MTGSPDLALLRMGTPRSKPERLRHLSTGRPGLLLEPGLNALLRSVNRINAPHRVSYENHAEVWPTLEEAFGDFAVRMNAIRKHVASRTLTR